MSFSATASSMDFDFPEQNSMSVEGITSMSFNNASSDIVESRTTLSSSSLAVFYTTHNPRSIFYVRIGVKNTKNNSKIEV